MEVTVTFDTSIPSEREALEEVIGEDEMEETLDEAEELSAVADEPASMDFAFDEEQLESPLADVIRTEEGNIHTFWNGEKTNFAQLAEFLLENPWSSPHEIAEALDWSVTKVNSVLTNAKNREAFYHRVPPFRELSHHTMREWNVREGMVTE